MPIAVPSNPTSGPLAPPVAHSIEVPGDSQEKLLADIEQLDVQTLWTRMAKLNPPLPSPKAIAHKWE